MTPSAQYFVDVNGNLAQASASVDNLWTSAKLPLMGGLQVYVTYNFISRWYYTYSTGTRGPFTYPEVYGKVLGPY